MENQNQSINYLNYDGKISAHYKIWLLNIILSILTLGIYSFWGRTRMRKYCASSYSLLGDRFEYTGTGGELFKGFLKVMSILFIFIIGLAILFKVVEIAFGINELLLHALQNIVIYITYIVLFFMAIYSIIGYRYSRTTWRGIRGGLTGSAKYFAYLSISRLFLNIITFGYLIPHSQLKTRGYVINNSYFGSAKAEFSGSAKSLIGVNMITLLLIIPTLGFSRFWYLAAFTRYLFANTKIASTTLVANYTGGKLFSLFLGNILILIVTLGFGFPIVIWRNLRFISQNIAIIGDIDISKISQSTSKSSSIGEGLNDVFDMGTGLM